MDFLGLLLCIITYVARSVVIGRAGAYHFVGDDAVVLLITLLVRDHRGRRFAEDRTRPATICHRDFLGGFLLFDIFIY